jgi:hypothetical protein
VTELIRSIINAVIHGWRTAAYGISSLFMPSRWKAIPRKLAQISLPGIVSTIVFLMLVAVASIVVAFLRSDRGKTYYEPAWFRDISIIIMLIIVITMVTYYTVKLWMEGEGSPFEDIDRAWQAGIEALEKNHFDLRQIPMFLVLGSEGPDQNRVMLNAARVSLTVDNVPPGTAALHWYANQDAIYLVCTEVGCLSRLAQYAKQGGIAAASGPAPVPTGPSISSTAFPSQDLMEAAQRMSAERDSAMGGSGDGDAAGSVSIPAPASGMDIRGTMMVSAVDVRETIRPSAAPRMVGRSLELNREEVELQRRRLAYLCKLLERNRRPLCGVNGVMTLVPIKLISGDSSEGAWTKEAIRNDLDGLIVGLKLRFPVVALVTGLEEEKGFDELIRRVGRERAVGQRFGKGFGVWDPPIDEEIEALCKHACGAFEDWAYYLFKEPNSLSKPGNRSLYMLLCKVRRTLQPRLEKILIGGYSFDPETQPNATPILFAGCYFAGTGETPERQAFVKGVFDRLPEQQEELEWTEAALREEDRYRIWSTVAFSTAALLLIGIGILGWRLYNGSN